MSGLIYTDGTNEYAQGVNKSFVSTANFGNEFYLYTTGLSSTFQPTGKFSLVTASGSALCPAGRVLHCTGKRLNPKTHPMTTFVGALSSAKFLLSVYDPITFLTGFIDPTSSTFAKFDQNVPNFNDLGNNGSGVLPPLGGQGGKLALTDSTLVITAYSLNTVTLDADNASVGQINIPVGQGGAATNTIVVSTTAATANSKVYLTPRTPKNTVTDIYVSNLAAGSFTVSVVTSGNIATQAYVFNFLVVN